MLIYSFHLVEISMTDEKAATLFRGFMREILNLIDNQELSPDEKVNHIKTLCERFDTRPGPKKDLIG